jgi:hypothetical protein
MPLSESAIRLKKMIEKAIADHRITRDEMELIQHIAAEDGHIDRHENALLQQLHDMVADGTVRIAS